MGWMLVAAEVVAMEYMVAGSGCKVVASGCKVDMAMEKVLETGRDLVVQVQGLKY